MAATMEGQDIQSPSMPIAVQEEDSLVMMATEAKRNRYLAWMITKVMSTDEPEFAKIRTEGITMKNGKKILLGESACAVIADLSAKDQNAFWRMFHEGDN